MKRRVFIILLIITISVFSAIFLFSSRSSYALTPKEVLVVYNTEPSIRNASQGTAEYYSLKRGIPSANLLGISTTASEFVPDADYINNIAAPIWKVLSQPAYSNIKVILLCYGVPYKFTSDPHAGVDSALMLLGNPDVLNEQSWRLGFPNPYYNANTDFASFKNSPANVINRGNGKPSWKINYLVTRLDGYSIPTTTVTVNKKSYTIPSDVKAMIDRAVRADAAGKAAAFAGTCILDDAPFTNTARTFSKPLEDYLKKLGMKVDRVGTDSYDTNTYAVNKSNVILYTSSGYYDFAAKQQTVWWRPNIKPWKDGAIGVFYKVSYDGEILRQPHFIMPVQDNEPSHIEAGKLKVYMWLRFRLQIPFKENAYNNYKLVLYKADGTELANTTFNSMEQIDNSINGKRDTTTNVPVAKIDLTKLPQDSLAGAYWVAYYPKDDPLHPGEPLRQNSYPKLNNDKSTNYGTTYAAVFGQCQSSELIREGCTAVTGNVAEPSANGCANPEVIFSQYATGRTWAESASMGFPAVSWMGVAIGDPLMAPFKK